MLEVNWGSFLRLRIQINFLLFSRRRRRRRLRQRFKDERGEKKVEWRNIE